MGQFVAAAAAAAAVTITLITGCGASDEAPSTTASPTSVITSTTRIAGAGVLGNQRRPDESCAAEPARLDPGPPDREVRHAAGTSQVRADPQRIVVLSGAELDALCALGLQSRIVASALPDGTGDEPGSQPSYLGAVVHDLPAVGTRNAPDLPGIEATAPDLILGSEAATPDAFPALSAIAPTVFSDGAGASWPATVRTVGAATGRTEAANELLAQFEQAAAKTGAQNDAAHFQASVVQLTENSLRVYGAANFPGSVLAEVGLDRPAAQRFTDQPYTEIDISDPDADLSSADGDIVYLSFASPAARDRAPDVLNGDAWKALSATRDDRVFAVNNEVWQTGQGIVAARGILADLRWVNAPIN